MTRETTRPEGPAPLWNSSETDRANAAVTHFAKAAEMRTGRCLPDYHQLWRWSVAELDEFWATVWDYFGLPPLFGEAGEVLAADRMPGAVWFPGVRLNFAEYLLSRGRSDSPAVVDFGEDGVTRELSRAQLRDEVGALAAALRSWGVGPGDVVAAYLPNISHCVIGLLAAASIGATWTSVGQDYAASAATDRLSQLHPVVLIAADGYQFGGRSHSRSADSRALLAALPSVRHAVWVGWLAAEGAGPGWISWEEATSGSGALDFERVSFDHPLWVLYSSGTTGQPKGIVHGHGGILLEMLTQIGLHWDVGDSDRAFWFTSPSWVMWNMQLSALALGSSIVCYDGSPVYPDPRALWSLVADLGVTFFGTSPGYLQASATAGVRPGAEFDLSRLRAIGSTGSPLPRRLHEWANEQLPAVPVYSMSGGTDIASAFFGGVPTVPVWAGELSVACLGVSAEAWSDDGRPVTGEIGELVMTRPLPSMPVRFWNDPDGSRYRDAYFSVFPGVWRHGDWISVTERGSVVVHGRSDATLNRNGIRMGSADIYAAVESVPGVREALVIGAELGDGEYWMPLFVALEPGCKLTEAFRRELVAAIRTKASPRHVPDEIIQVPGIPHTRTGKKLEVPVKRIIQGARAEDVVARSAVDDPGLLDSLQRIAATYPRTARPPH
jgi:acetoacetyl-CoA synthetase